MKRLIYLLSVTFLLLQSCSSKDDANSQTAVNSSTINVKYEIIASSNLRTNNLVGNPQITMTYTNSGGQQQIETTNYPNDFRTWNKTFTLTNTNRPLQLRLDMSQLQNVNYFLLKNGGTVKINLYLDGILTKSQTETSSTSYQQIGGDTWYSVYISNLVYTIQ
jgi:hypothetical protein